MPRNADAVGAVATLLSAGIRLQPLFLDAEQTTPSRIHNPGYRTIGAAYPITSLVPQLTIPLPFATTITGCGASLHRDAMTRCLIIPVFRNITSIDPVDTVAEMRVTRWYPIYNSLAPTVDDVDADITPILFLPVAQIYDWTVGNIVDSGLSDLVVGATGHLPDVLSAVTEIGAPDTILYSPGDLTADTPCATLIVDLHGASAVSIELRETPLSTDDSPDEAQVLIGFE